jgi:hypothetical protein
MKNQLTIAFLSGIMIKMVAAGGDQPFYLYYKPL